MVVYTRNPETNDFEKVSPGATTDTTLSQSGKPADAAAVGSALSNYATAADVSSQMNTKVDKVDGKGLSTNDYTTADKNKLDNINTLFSNPNLLINSNFRNPINQRGQTSYTATSRIYTIDRWTIGYGTLTINDASITFTGSSTADSSSRWFSQRFDHSLTGTHKLSFNCTSVTGEVLVVVRNNSSTGSDVTFTVSSGYNEFPINHPSGSFDEIFFRMVTSASFEIEWIKLEQGSITTPFIPKLYDEEFILCLRYYQKIKCRLIMSIYSSLYADGAYYFQVPMRAKPAVTVNSSTYFLGSLEEFVAPQETTVNTGYLNEKYALIKLKRATADTFTIGQTRNALIDLTIDAEIY